MEILWSDLSGGDYLVLLFLLSCSLGPYIYAILSDVSISLATVLSLLLVTFAQEAIRVFGIAFQPFAFLSLIPLISDDPTLAHRWITAAWLHSGWIHVLGNILVIALVGVPLEQKLGPRRWMIIYVLGLLAGNLTWVLTHADDPRPTVGASGAAFGLLGAYMACWPRDEIEFPLLFLIRAWPIWVICLVRIGLEVYMVFDLSMQDRPSNVAHLAHLGGFFGAYIVSRPIARTGDVPLEDEIGDEVAVGMKEIGVDPWMLAGIEAPPPVKRILHRLREEGDEEETRRAWIEELADNAICPICGGGLTALTNRSGDYYVTCSSDHKHISWP